MKKKLEQMRAQAAAAEDMLKALASRHRLMILCQLIDRAHSVGELAAFQGVRDSTISQHLALLRKDGMVSTRREGQTIWYSLASDPVRLLVTAIYDIYCGPQALCGPAASSKAAGAKAAGAKTTGASHVRPRTRTR